ncbi:MAG: HK97 gp10 family phage protein [Chloroflexi bacterium]|nr:HK97 gp10 family phage protein [Chloroflexota bacterium]
MTVSITADFSEVRDLLIVGGSAKVIREEMAKIAEEMRQFGLAQVGSFTPYRTGDLLNSEDAVIRSWAGSFAANGVSGFEITFFSETPYAGFVEDGTRYMAARKMFGQGINQNDYIFQSMLQKAADAIAERLSQP